MTPSSPPVEIAVVGGGPAGLMAAETLGRVGLSVTIYDRMPSIGRKFLLAGRGGLNLTHSEDFERFVTRYGQASPRLRAILEAFRPDDLRAWSAGLGQDTFVGSSGRVFPKAFKTSPLLRAWLQRLEGLGIRLALRHRFEDWDEEGRLVFVRPDGEQAVVAPAATILTLGGASWPRLGSDGSWTRLLAERGIVIAPLRPANAGFRVEWSPLFRDRFEGEPLKGVSFRFGDQSVRGEAIVSRDGIEGGAIYGLSAPMRDALAGGSATLVLDLRPDIAVDALARKLAAPRHGQSTSTFLRKAAGLSPVGIALLREHGRTALPTDAGELAALIKAIPIPLTGVKSIERAISTAGGIDLGELDENLMLRRMPGVFAAGEMLDWEAPTGGYLLQGAFATGVAAARGVLAHLGCEPSPMPH